MIGGDRDDLHHFIKTGEEGVEHDIVFFGYYRRSGTEAEVFLSLEDRMA